MHQRTHSSNSASDSQPGLFDRSARIDPPSSGPDQPLIGKQPSIGRSGNVKRTIEISPREISPRPGEGAQETPVCRLRVELDQLKIQRGDPDPANPPASIPIEDIGYLILSDRAISLTQSVMVRLLHHGGVMVVCDDTNTPAGLLLSMHDNELTARRIREQANMSLPKRKRLWQQIITHKVRGQALNLDDTDPTRERLLGMAARVKSGDTENIEGQAARFYWPALLGNDFRRDPDGDWPNPALNYGYMILRAACCRAITAAGLHPVFSLQHAHRNNTFALADDIVEIFRPRVDRAVASLVKLGATQIDRDSKKVLLSLLGEPITLSNTTGPMMQQLSLIVSSLVDCIEGRRGNLDLPEQTLQGVKILPDRFYQSPGRTKKGGEPDDEPSE